MTTRFIVGNETDEKVGGGSTWFHTHEGSRLVIPESEKGNKRRGGVCISQINDELRIVRLMTKWGS